jgi:plasmid stability protein
MMPLSRTFAEATMKRTQIQLDDGTYQRLRQRAYEQGCSMSAVVRDVLAEALGTPRTRRPKSIRDFTFVGSGATRQGRLSPVSDRHDEALAELLAKEQGR